MADSDWLDASAFLEICSTAMFDTPTPSPVSLPHGRKPALQFSHLQPPRYSFFFSIACRKGCHVSKVLAVIGLGQGAERIEHILFLLEHLGELFVFLQFVNCLNSMAVKGRFSHEVVIALVARPFARLATGCTTEKSCRKNVMSARTNCPVLSA